MSCEPGLKKYRAELAVFLTASAGESPVPPEFEGICRMCALEMYARLCHLMTHATQDVSMIAIETYEERETAAEGAETSKPPPEKPTIN